MEPPHLARNAVSNSPLGSLTRILQGTLRSRLGYILAMFSLCFLLLEIVSAADTHPQFVPCVPTYNETLTLTEILAPKPIWVLAIGFLYVPSILITTAFTKLLALAFSLSCTPTARVEFVLFLIFSSCQWMLIGYAIERLFRRLHPRPYGQQQDGAI